MSYFAFSQLHLNFYKLLAFLEMSQNDMLFIFIKKITKLTANN